MTINTNAALEQIDAALTLHKDFKDRLRKGKASMELDHTELIFVMMGTLARLAPNTVYHVRGTDEDELAGTLKALRRAYQAGYLETVTESIHRQTYSDFLAMAEHLLSDAYHDHGAVVAAAALAGGVLEQHLRALCIKHGVDPNSLDKKGSPQPKMIKAMNDDLYRSPPGVYSQVFMQQIKGFAVIRNDAAHGVYTKVDRKQVELMIAGLRHLMLTYPA